MITRAMLACIAWFIWGVRNDKIFQIVVMIPSQLMRKGPDFLRTAYFDDPVPVHLIFFVKLISLPIVYLK